jgi:uncharacterized membrane protein
MPQSPLPQTHVPFIDQVRQELSLNVGEHERSLSTLAGASLLGFGVTQRGWRRWVIPLLGAALIKRGLTGHCDVYQQLKIDSRHPAPRGAGQ